MASDLHDAIASRLSAIAFHSGAALAAPPSSERDRSALDLARNSSIAALEDMRAMITVLRSEQSGSSGDAALSPPIEWLSQLTDAARATGSDVHIHGAVPRGLPPALGQAIYRIVQESLTNAAKHAPRSTVDLHFDFVEGTGQVLVQNDIPAERTPQKFGGVVNSGAGLEIMRERAEAFGGTLFAGARDSRWCVEMRVPAVSGRGRE
jgi:signal transduction histidine kinase